MNCSTRHVLKALIVGVCLGGGGLRAEQEAPAGEHTVVPTPGLKEGDKAPDPQVAKRNGDPVQLADLYPRGPIVLVFYRGGWCPYCNKALVGIQEHLETMGKLGGTVLGVSPEEPQFLNKTLIDQRLGFDLVSDYKGDAARQFRILFEMPIELREKYKEYGVDVAQRNWDRSYTLPYPSVFVIDRAGIIRYAFSSEDYKVRADPQEIVDILRVLDDERKAARDAGRKKPIEP